MSKDALDLILRGVGAFAPEIKAITPEIEAAVAAVEGAEEAAAPFLSGSSPPTFFQLIPMFAALEPKLPDLVKAAQTFGKVEAIAKEYAAKVEAAEAAK